MSCSIHKAVSKPAAVALTLDEIDTDVLLILLGFLDAVSLSRLSQVSLKMQVCVKPVCAIVLWSRGKKILRVKWLTATIL
jgi:hypothetical protein